MVGEKWTWDKRWRETHVLSGIGESNGGSEGGRVKKEEASSRV